MAYIYQFIGMSSKSHSIPDCPRYTLCGYTYKRNKRLLNDIANHDFESRRRTYVITMTKCPYAKNISGHMQSLFWFKDGPGAM